MTKIKDQLRIDYPPAGAVASLSMMISSGSGDGSAGDGKPDEPMDAASELRDRIRKVATAKVAKMFQVFSPKPNELSASSIATVLSDAVAAKVDLQADECGIVVINPKMWTETKARPDASFAPCRGLMSDIGMLK